MSAFLNFVLYAYAPPPALHPGLPPGLPPPPPNNSSGFEILRSLLDNTLLYRICRFKNFLGS